MKGRGYFKGEGLSFDLPDDWNLLAMAEPREVAAVKDIEAEVKRALDDPIGMEPLSKIIPNLENKKTVILSEDQTRPTRVGLIALPLLNELNRLGIPDEDIQVIIARGTHRHPMEDEVRDKLGEEVLKRVKISVHDADDQDNLVLVGTTSRGTPCWTNRLVVEADLKIGIGTSNPHYFAGYEGGSKALLPGCSSFKTITTNHSRTLGNARVRELRIKGNDVREDMNEVSPLLERVKGIKHRILDFVVNPDNSLAKAVYGKPPEAHTAIAEGYAKKVWAVEAEPASFVITVADGPLGMNLYQAFKAASFSVNIVTPKAENKPRVLVAAPLRDGIGSDAFAQEMERYAGWEPDNVIEDLKKRAERLDITEASHKPNRLALDDRIAEFGFIAPNAPSEVEELLSKTKYRFYRSLDEAIEDTPKGLLKNVAVIPYGSRTVPVPK